MTGASEFHSDGRLCGEWLAEHESARLGPDQYSLTMEMVMRDQIYNWGTTDLGQILTMKDVILANNGLLVVWQVAAVDAEHLIKELGSERITVDDITSLPVHHAYVRATTNGQRMPAFSMQVRRPSPGKPDLVKYIKANNEEFTLSRKEAQETVEASMHAKMKDRMESRRNDTSYTAVDLDVRGVPDTGPETRQSTTNQSQPSRNSRRRRRSRNRRDASQSGQVDSRNSNVR